MDAPLITPSDLAALLTDRAARMPVLLDVRWTLAGADRAAYRAGHLPGALFLDLDAELAGPPGQGGRHPLPEPADLQRLWREVGLHADSDVVVYDARDSSVAARGWWLLRWSGFAAVGAGRTADAADDAGAGSGRSGTVRVLDGGLAGWLAAGGSVDTGDVARPGGGTVQVTPGAMATVDLDDAATAAADPDRVLLDARAVARYRGEVEPVDPVAGHIPGSVSLPLTDLVDADGRFLPPPALRRRFVAAGVGPQRPAVASCGSGVSACHLILAGVVAGFDLALFPASYSGWCAAHRPVATGSSPAGSSPAGS